jgi:hemerythrin-like domain-containing protein
MDFFDNLIDDHRLILTVLDALERFIGKVEAGAELDLVELNRFAVFLREFVDLIHQEKEETLLFPAMARLGYARGGAPIAHVHAEHDREHKLIFELRQVVVRDRPFSSTKRARIVGLVHEIIAFLREHIRKENELLYPTVKSEFSGQTLDDVTKKLWTGEQAERRIVEDAWLRTLANELAGTHGAG